MYRPDLTYSRETITVGVEDGAVTARPGIVVSVAVAFVDDDAVVVFGGDFE